MMNYSDNQLTKLAQTNPKELANLLINPSVNVKTLTFGVETLGEEVNDETIVLPVFRILIKHINAVVREGAANGISSFYTSKIPPEDILDKLKLMSTNDPSLTLRDQVKNMLNQYSQ